MPFVYLVVLLSLLVSGCVSTEGTPSGFSCTRKITFLDDRAVFCERSDAYRHTGKASRRQAVDQVNRYLSVLVKQYYRRWLKERCRCYQTESQHSLDIIRPRMLRREALVRLDRLLRQAVKDDKKGKGRNDGIFLRREIRSRWNTPRTRAVLFIRGEIRYRHFHQIFIDTLKARKQRLLSESTRHLNDPIHRHRIHHAVAVLDRGLE